MATKLFPENVDFDVSQTAKRDKSLSNWRVSALAGWATSALAAVAIFVIFIFFMRPNIVIVKVDRQTGVTETVVGYEAPKPGSKDFENLAKNNLIEHVRCRVGFTRGEAQSCYDRVTYQSAGSLKGEWDNSFNPEKNPNAPLNIYGAADQIRITKPSVSFFPTNKDGEIVATVRFDREMRLSTSAATTRRMNATISFRYDRDNIPTKASDVWINPLGFSVLNFRTDTETAEQPITTTAPQ